MEPHGLFLRYLEHKEPIVFFDKWNVHLIFLLVFGPKSVEEITIYFHIIYLCLV
jgi:hypothetical protein